MNKSARLRLLAVIGIVLALALPFAPWPRLLFPGDGLTARIGREAIWWMFGALILYWLLAVERLPLASINLKPPRIGTAVWGVVFVIPLMASVMLSYAVIFPILHLHLNLATTRSLISTPLWLQNATMVRAGVVEEIIYRGYAIERITAVTGQRWLAVLGAGAMFIAAHVESWGYAQLIVVGFATVILTALYLWRRDLVACMIAHALTDVIGFALARAHA